MVSAVLPIQAIAAVDFAYTLAGPGPAVAELVVVGPVDVELVLGAFALACQIPFVDRLRSC